jgi:hypothetical protein
LSAASSTSSTVAHINLTGHNGNQLLQHRKHLVDLAFKSLTFLAF